jgi:hypothetical protein
MSPPKRGFALLGYYGPWIGMSAAATGLGLLMRAWSRRMARGASAAVPAAAAPVDATPAELERLQNEIKNFEA